MLEALLFRYILIRYSTVLKTLKRKIDIKEMPDTYNAIQKLIKVQCSIITKRCQKVPCSCLLLTQAFKAKTYHIYVAQEVKPCGPGSKIRDAE